MFDKAKSVLLGRLDRNQRLQLLLYGGLALVLPVLGYLVFETDKMLLIAGLFTVFLIFFAILKPEAATLVVVFVIYSNLAVVGKTFHGIPDVLAGSFSLLLCLPLANYLFIKKQKLIIDYVFLLMILLLAIAVASSFFAKDVPLAFEWVLNYLFEGMAIYFLFVNVIRTFAVLRKVIWVLLLTGAMLGSMSLYQELFSDYRTTFGGLAQRSKDVEFEDEFYGDVYGQGEFFKTRDDVRGANRSGGPIGKANRYAQIMIVLFALGLFQFWGEKTRKLKMLAAALTVLILSGMLLTYSRGAFITMCLMTVLLVILRYVRMRQLLITLAAVIGLMSVAAPGYFVRVDSIRGIAGLFSDSAEVRPDGTTKGRLTEMLAAFLAFLDYPILGVGPAQYTPFYSKEYQNDPDIAFRFLGRNRRAHILYFELAAETGILGIGTFMAIVAFVLYRLWIIRRKTIPTHPLFANVMTSLWFALIGYLGTAVFLHLSYQRFYWFAVALCGAGIHVYESEIRPQIEKAEKAEKTQKLTNGNLNHGVLQNQPV